MKMKEFKKKIRENNGKNLKGQKIKDFNGFMEIELKKKVVVKIKSTLTLNRKEVTALLSDLDLSNIGKNSVIKVSEVCDVCYNFKCVGVKENEILFVTC